MDEAVSRWLSQLHEEQKCSLGCINMGLEEGSRRHLLKLNTF